MSSKSFWRELKRRHVYRVAAAYAVVGWLLIEVATQVFPAFHFPDWAAQLVILLIVIGFPIALVLAWAFEMTPDGVRHTEPGDSPQARAPDQQRKVRRQLDFAIIGVLAVAVLVLAWQRWMPHAVPPGASGATAAATSSNSAVAAQATAQPSAIQATKASSGARAIAAKSIAVLPFENLSNDKDNDYFVTGMQDLILTKLAGIGDIKVIARTSTRKFKSHPDDLKTIGQQLGVATILEGSVQKTGNEVLINVQLVDAVSNAHIWAESYQRTLTNVFAVEGEVAEKVARTLKVELSPAETKRLAASLSTDPLANDLFMHAEYFTKQGDSSNSTAAYKQADALYRQAIARDPGFALAHARLSYAQGGLAWFGGGGADGATLYADAREQAELALALAPDLADAYLALGLVDLLGKGDTTGALQAFAEALALRPNASDALQATGYVLRRQGRFDEAVHAFQRALDHDPRNSVVFAEMGGTFMLADRYSEAEQALRHALELDPDNVNARFFYSRAVEFSSGNLDWALAEAQGDDPRLTLRRVDLLTLQRRFAQALAVLDSIPDTTDNFALASGSKALNQARLRHLLGDDARARALYARAVSAARAELAAVTGGNPINRGIALSHLAQAELGAGNEREGLDAVAKSLAIVDTAQDHFYGPWIMQSNAQTYAGARRADLAVPLLAKALASPGIGVNYSPVLLWIDPAWDPIRHDPRFQALLKKYAKDKPGAVSAAPASSAAGQAGHP